MARFPLKKLCFREKTEIKDQDRVKLPVILGIKPRVYLAVLYGAALILALFLLLIRPGLSKPGSIGIFTSEPRGAAVRIDDVTLGYTPCRIFIPRGTRSIEFVLPGFKPDKQELDVKGRIFGSLFFPSKITVTGKLDCPDPAGTLALYALEYIHWAAAGEQTEGFQNPMVLSEGVSLVGPAAKDPAIKESMQGILENCLRHTVTRSSLRDLVRAQFLLDGGGNSASSFSALSSIQKMASHIGKNGAYSMWLAEILPGDSAGKLIQSAWFNENAVSKSGESGAIDISLRFPSSLSLEGIDFAAVNPGYLEKHGRREIMPPMLIARFPVSEDAWARFTGEKSEWAEHNRNSLVERGLVGEDYLAMVPYPAYPFPAVPGISWHAAKAYCEWLSAKLPPSLDGWELRLPSEAEWEYAMLRSDLNPGLLWEWCGNSFAVLDFSPAHEESLILFEKAALVSGSPPLERAVRGGSWINPPGSTTIESRGSLPPETSSPFAGFRPVIVPKSE